MTGPYPQISPYSAAGMLFDHKISIKPLLEQWSYNKPEPVLGLKLQENLSSLQNGNLHKIFTFVEYTFIAVSVGFCTARPFTENTIYEKFFCTIFAPHLDHNRGGGGDPVDR